MLVGKVYTNMKCEDCNIDMKYIKQKVMINKLWSVYECPRCKNTLNKAIIYVEKDEEK